MINVYYTATTGRRSDNGHTITKGRVYFVDPIYHRLQFIGNYRHQSGGASIEESLLALCSASGLDTGEGYYGHWQHCIQFYEIGKDV